MRGLGTIINTLAVIVGGLIGMRFQSGLSEKMQTTLMQSCGIATIFIGTAGTLAKMLQIPIKIGASCRGDVGIAPYIQTRKCLRIRRKSMQNPLHSG